MRPRMAAVGDSPLNAPMPELPERQNTNVGAPPPLPTDVDRKRNALNRLTDPANPPKNNDKGVWGLIGDMFRQAVISGGEAARAVVAYLEALGDAEPLLETVPLSEEEAARFLGHYSFGSDPSQQIEVSWARGAVQFRREGTSARVLTRRADGGFSPAGAPEVRIRFVEEAGQVGALEVLDPGVVVRARKRG